MPSFNERLSKAVERGHKRNQQRKQQERARQLTEEELKSLHSQYRLQLSERIEKCLQQLPEHFPGFQVETMFGDRGWGAAVSRDDLGAVRGRRVNYFSRLEMSIRPYSSLHVVELTAKGTIRNKEVFNRSHYEPIKDADTDTFDNLIDVWVLEYAELYAAGS